MTGHEWIPLTRAMERKLEELHNADLDARVVGTREGLPVIRYRSGRHVLLTTTGRLERIPTPGH